MTMLRAPDTHPPASGPRSARHGSALSQALSHNIIPRLIEAHRAAPALPTLQPGTAPPFDPAPLARSLLAPDPFEAFEHVNAMRRQGLSIESLYLDVVAPVARLLGDWWAADECSFTDVTLGAGRLQHILREHSLSRELARPPVGDGRRLLLAPAPGEQHSLGLLMVAEFFRQAGWEVHGGPTEAGADPVRTLAREWFDVVGFSIAAEVHFPELRSAIAQVRATSRNPRIGVMVGGAACDARPGVHASLCTDIALADATRAPVLASNFLEKLPR